jgi:hypothetical protein
VPSAFGSGATRARASLSFKLFVGVFRISKLFEFNLRFLANDETPDESAFQRTIRIAFR